MKKSLVYITVFVFVFGLFAINSCDDRLEIRSDYEFTVTHLPVPKRLKIGETAEIRFELERSGRYSGAQYYVRFFQSDGTGVLRFDGLALIPNDSYQLEKELFRMYYTSQCEEQQAIDLTFYDNFGNSCQLSFTFSNASTKKEDE